MIYFYKKIIKNYKFFCYIFGEKVRIFVVDCGIKSIPDTLDGVILKIRFEKFSDQFKFYFFKLVVIYNLGLFYLFLDLSIQLTYFI